MVELSRFLGLFFYHSYIFIALYGTVISCPLKVLKLGYLKIFL